MPEVPRYHAHVPRAASTALLVAVLTAVAAAPSSALPTSASVAPQLQSTETASPTAEPTPAAPEPTPTSELPTEHVHPTEANTPTTSPSETPVASATATLATATLPAATQAPSTPTAGPHGIEPYPSAPLCPSHDSREYHALWDAERGCHYDHSHGDDPHSVDDIFGTAVYDFMDGEISYPWHTPAENESIKHKSYIWLVERDLPCYSRYTSGCLTAFRAFVHNDLYNPGPTHHSALLEAIVCDEANPDRCGYVLVSGHQATGDLFIDRVRIHDAVEPRGAPRPVMLHSDHQPGSRDFAAWYPVFYGWMRVSTQIRDMWGYYPVTSDAGPEDFIRLAGNASSVQPHIFAIGWRPRDLRLLDPDRDGRANYDGYVDVHTGVPGGACVGVSGNCAPLIFRDVPVVPLAYQYNYGPYHELDVFFGRQSSNWLEFPGFQP